MKSLLVGSATLLALVLMWVIQSKFEGADRRAALGLVHDYRAKGGWTIPEILDGKHAGHAAGWTVETQSSCLHHYEKVSAQVDGVTYLFMVDIDGPSIHPGNPASEPVVQQLDQPRPGWLPPAASGSGSAGPAACDACVRRRSASQAACVDGARRARRLRRLGAKPPPRARREPSRQRRRSGRSEPDPPRRRRRARARRGRRPLARRRCRVPGERRRRAHRRPTPTHTRAWCCALPPPGPTAFSSRSRWPPAPPTPSAAPRGPPRSGAVGMVGHLLRYHRRGLSASSTSRGAAPWVSSSASECGAARGRRATARPLAVWTLGPHDVSVLHALDPSPIRALSARGAPGGDPVLVEAELGLGPARLDAPLAGELGQGAADPGWWARRRWPPSTTCARRTGSSSAWSRSPSPGGSRWRWRSSTSSTAWSGGLAPGHRSTRA